jgi:O-antigen/teichoic acid export membrane protein
VAAFAFVAVRAIVTPAVAILLSYRHAWIYLGFRYAQVGRLRALFWPATANVCFPLAQALNLQGMVLVVGSTLGPLAVVTFSTLRTLSRFAFQPVLSISHAAEPEMASAYVNPDSSLLRKLYLHSLRASLWMSLCCACFLTLTGEWVLNLWTHGRVQMDVALFHWLLATAVASVLWYGPLMVLKAANRHLSASVLYVSVSCGAIVLAGLLLGARGNLAIIGLPMLVIDIVMGGYALRAAARLCGCTTLAGLKAALNPRPLFKLALVKSHVH